ncbi:hypothetical protein [Silvanigrella aquatica]|uniref:Uncharacterized protein n=1 Tax=Silvanigrella aquatica TaxID=1915309 RepID=A0A1L4D194_9BACT|nr:hypothetical protein [Silvanigrella aquatica]APJ03966.1 hypothetical protein AXG55_08620 [Silvanigrella aquatica]
MITIFKYLFLFIAFGIIWFMILSIQVSKSSTLFLVLQKELKMVPGDEEEDISNKKEIDRQKVIDAISKAFND